jgi:hypothetical protein
MLGPCRLRKKQKKKGRGKTKLRLDTAHKTKKRKRPARTGDETEETVTTVHNANKIMAQNTANGTKQKEERK